MIYKTAIHTISSCNAKFQRRVFLLWNRMHLRNRCVSIISNNCLGGMISHDLGLRFNSPTVNLFFYPPLEFIIFCSHLKSYVDAEVVPYKDSDCPAGVIHGPYGDVHLFFLHYKSFDDAKAKWDERKKRIDWNNICVIMEEDICDEGVISQFDSLPYSKKCIITGGHHPDIKSFFSMKNNFYGESYYPGKIFSYTDRGVLRYYDSFDYVSFIDSGKIKTR